LVLYTKLLQAVIEQVEAEYWRESSPTVGGNDGFYLGGELFSRIKAARGTKDDKTLQTFLDRLSSRIGSSCRRLRNEKVAELDTDTPFSPDYFRRFTTPSSTTSSSSAEEGNVEASDRGIKTESFGPDIGQQSRTRSAPDVGHQITSHSAQDIGVQSTTLSVPNIGVQSAPLSAPAASPTSQRHCLNCKRPVQRFVTKSSNINGNANRTYLKCVPCDRFHSFADEQGINAGNLKCHCGEASREQLSGPRNESQRVLHYVCSTGGCNFFHKPKITDGQQQPVYENLRKSPGLNNDSRTHLRIMSSRYLGYLWPSFALLACSLSLSGLGSEHHAG
jgi:hypothetical protein